MRWKWAIVMLLALPLAVSAADDEQRNAQISAATTNAIDALRKQVAESKITDQVTVKDLLDRTAGLQTLTDTLSSAQQIGGPRHFDDKVCEVRLEISGTRVLQSLQRIAASNPRRTPISADQLAIHLRGWEKKTFTATGRSAGAGVVDVIRPGPDSGVWNSVSDASRKQAVYDAKRNATTQALTPVASVPIAGGKTVGDAMAVEPIRRHMLQWLDGRPITQFEFRDDQNVRVTLSAPADETFEQLRTSLAQQRDIAIPKDETAWLSVKQDFVNKYRTPVGIAPATQPATVIASRYPLPRNPPDWAQQQIDTEASAKVKGGALHSRTAAETSGREKAQTKLEALPLGDGKTVGEAAKADPRVSDCVKKTVRDAKTKSEYLSDGSVKVRVYLDLRNFWQEVSESQ